ncbi:UNKNOWN [Stylonychia lemnae]|uniref:Uncharacterized protein n=1 Tax=Stylonychia lemnae TaxID=5949 RepID=A0A077ZR66_STYLE|nr:UNKNOWN [Stylonychia lemnae]|eukprot:CDW72408.1 UNKNOWN [Stylonychia lemnae]
MKANTRASITSATNSNYQQLSSQMTLFQNINSNLTNRQYDIKLLKQNRSASTHRSNINQIDCLSQRQVLEQTMNKLNNRYRNNHKQIYSGSNNINQLKFMSKPYNEVRQKKKIKQQYEQQLEYLIVQFQL